MVHERLGVRIGRLAFCAGVLLLWFPPHVRAQNRALFSADEGPQRQVSRTVTGDPMVIRSRQATVDLTLLAAGGAESSVAAGAARPAARSVDLNLFANMDVVAHLDRVEVVPSVGYAWVGHIAGQEDTEVVLAVAGDVLTGSIKLPGQMYSIRSSDASYVIAELNSRAIPGDEVAVPRLAGGLASAPLSAPTESGDTFDLLLYYTTAVKNAAGGAGPLNSLIAASIAHVNTAYAGSGVATRVRLVAALETPYRDSGSTATDLESLRTNADIRAARDRYGADIVSMLVLSDPISSGRGYVTVSQGRVFPDSAYNVVVHYPNVGYIYSLAHELGHNFGCLHERGNNGGDDTLGAFPYSLGYSDPAHGFHDVMSYGIGCTNCETLNQFSSPTITYRGVPVGTGSQDAARTINSTRSIVASYRTAAGATEAPNAPMGFVAGASGSTVSLGWSAPAGGGTPTAYIIEAGSGSGLADLASFSTNSTATSFSAGGVANGTYYVRVRATNSAGTSGASNEVKLVVGAR
jgi:hypothetical protein